MQMSWLRRWAAFFAVLLLLTMAMPSAFARGSFGGGGRSFGGGSFGGGRSFGGGGFRSPFGSSRPSFAPAPRPSFTPPPVPIAAPRPSFTPPPVPMAAPRPSFNPAPSGGSFGRAGGVGSPVSNRFQSTTGTGGSFGKSGAAGARTFTSVGSHPNAAPPPSTQFYGSPYSNAYAHPYSYGGRPANAYFTGGYPDYSFGYYRHPYFAYMPWSPVFYYNPPFYNGSGYVSGGFSFARFLLGIVFWIVVIAVVVRIVNHFRSQRLS